MASEPGRPALIAWWHVMNAQVQSRRIGVSTVWHALIVIGASSAVCGSRAAADWPFVRGPRYDGRSTETGLAEAWPKSGPPVVWERALGQGYSGFVAAGDCVFTQFQTLAGQYVVCLSARSGESLWQYRYGLPYEPAGLYPGPRATPTLSDGRVYFAGPDGKLGCLDFQGKLLWSVPLYDRFGGTPPGFGYACTPVIEEGLVFVPVGGPGSSVVALDARSGQTVWQAGDDAISYSPVLPVTLAGRRLIVAQLENALVAHDARSGKPLFRRQLSHGYDEHSAWPLYDEPHLWMSGPFHNGSQLWELRDDEAGPRVVWKKSILSNDVVSSVLVDGKVFDFDLKDVQAKVHRPSRGTFRCVDFLTGDEAWSSESPGHASVLAADEKLILLNDIGELIIARASPDRYQELGRWQALEGGLSWTPPMLHQRRVYLRNHHRAICLDLSRPESSPDDRSSPAVRRLGELSRRPYRDWSSLLGIEPEYAMDVPTWRWLRRWHGISCGLLLMAGVLAGPCLGRGWFGRPTAARQDAWLLVFWLLGLGSSLVGTTLLSRQWGAFIFTWQLAPFLAFDACVAQVPSVAGGDMRWRGRVAAGCFVLVAAGYFLLCRRLSLATEWIFLTGFAAALPLAWLGHRWARHSTWPWGVRMFCTSLAYTAYYWSSVAWLMAKYDIPSR